jgi:hypothetical protein
MCHLKRWSFMRGPEETYTAGIEQKVAKGTKARRRRRLGTDAPRGLPPWPDVIALAFEREREARRWPVWQPEPSARRIGDFKCVCCGRHRGGSERREPESEVCVRCVKAAGYLN